LKLNIQIEDTLHDLYEREMGFPKAYTHIKRAIEEFSRIAFNDRVLILHGDQRRELEAVFQTTLDTPEKLIKLVKNMNSVKIQGVEVNFDEADLARMKVQASFHSRTQEEFIKMTVDEAMRYLMDRM